MPEENVDIWTKKDLYTYLKNMYTPERMVICGVGIEHELLVNLTREHFIEKRQPIWLEDPEQLNEFIAVDDSLAQYTGGLEVVRQRT